MSYGNIGCELSSGSQVAAYNTNTHTPLPTIPLPKQAIFEDSILAWNMTLNEMARWISQSKLYALHIRNEAKQP